MNYNIIIIVLFFLVPLVEMATSLQSEVGPLVFDAVLFFFFQIAVRINIPYL